MTQPGSIIPPQPGWWVRDTRSGTTESTYGWDAEAGGSIPQVYGAKTRILLPHMASQVYPVLMPLRQAMRGGKIFTRPPVDEYGDPGIGTQTSIKVPRPEHPTYPLLPTFRLGMRTIKRVSDVVRFDSLGASDKGLKSSWAWSHTLGANATALFVHLYLTYTTAPGALTVKVGSTTIPNMVNLPVGTQSGITCVALSYAILNPATGVQAMTAQLASGSAYIAVNSVAYTNVSSLGAPVTNTGISTSLSSGSVTAQSPQAISQMFGLGLSAVTTISSYNYTQRSTIQAISGSNNTMLIGDAPGNAGVNLTATGSPSDYWGSIAIPLLTAR